MTRAVLDANVLVAAAIAPAGAPADCLRAHAEGRFELICSNKLLDEPRAVLVRPKLRRYLDAAEAARFCDRLERDASMSDDLQSPARISIDPADDYLIALAVATRAHVIVSGDAHLLDIDRPPVRVVTPRVFLALLPE